MINPFAEIKRLKAEVERLKAVVVTHAAAEAALIVERDTALMERNAAIDRVRWTALDSRELAALAKTGCAHCHGAGWTGTVTTCAVCPCVLKVMRADRKYAFGTNGEPLRLCTSDEIMAHDAMRGEVLRG